MLKNGKDVKVIYSIRQPCGVSNAAPVAHWRGNVVKARRCESYFIATSFSKDIT